MAIYAGRLNSKMEWWFVYWTVWIQHKITAHISKLIRQREALFKKSFELEFNAMKTILKTRCHNILTGVTAYLRGWTYVIRLISFDAILTLRLSSLWWVNILGDEATILYSEYLVMRATIGMVLYSHNYLCMQSKALTSWDYNDLVSQYSEVKWGIFSNSAVKKCWMQLWHSLTPSTVWGTMRRMQWCKNKWLRDGWLGDKITHV